MLLFVKPGSFDLVATCWHPQVLPLRLGRRDLSLSSPNPWLGRHKRVSGTHCFPRPTLNVDGVSLFPSSKDWSSFIRFGKRSLRLSFGGRAKARATRQHIYYCCRLSSLDSSLEVNYLFHFSLLFIAVPKVRRRIMAFVRIGWSTAIETVNIEYILVYRYIGQSFAYDHCSSHKHCLQTCCRYALITYIWVCHSQRQLLLVATRQPTQSTCLQDTYFLCFLLQSFNNIHIIARVSRSGEAGPTAEDAPPPPHLHLCPVVIYSISQYWLEICPILHPAHVSNKQPRLQTEFSGQTRDVVPNRCWKECLLHLFLKWNSRRRGEFFFFF